MSIFSAVCHMCTNTAWHPKKSVSLQISSNNVVRYNNQYYRYNDFWCVYTPLLETQNQRFHQIDHIYAIYTWFWAKMGPNFDPEYFHNYEELENDIPTDRKPIGISFKIYGAHPSMCTHRHTIEDFLKISEILALGPLRSEGIVPVWCTYLNFFWDPQILWSCLIKIFSCIHQVLG